MTLLRNWKITLKFAIKILCHGVMVLDIENYIRIYCTYNTHICLKGFYNFGNGVKGGLLYGVIINVKISTNVMILVVWSKKNWKA